jgi:hypothetical protein
MFIAFTASTKYSTSFCVAMRYYDMKAKVGMVQLVETVVTRQRHRKHVFAASDTAATRDDRVFSMQSPLGSAARFHSNESTRNNTGVSGRLFFCSVCPEAI